MFFHHKKTFPSPFTGELHPITDCPDEAFSQKMTGDGFFVYPTSFDVVAPCDSTVEFVFDTRHALGLRTDQGLEYMLHIGIDTVEMQGCGFTVFVENGQHVRKGDRLLSFDDEAIRAAGHSDACLCVFTDEAGPKDVQVVRTGKIRALEDAVEY